MQTHDPLKARQWFNLRGPVNWAVCLVVFIPLVFLLQHILPFLLADAIAIAFTFCLYFFFLHKRAIAIECPHCSKHIETNTPWICGNKDKHCRNDQVDDFPFIHRCQHCGFIPKAYQCHHCGELIFLSPDKQTSGYAKCADLPVLVKSRPVKKNMTVEKAAKQNAEKSDLLHELEVTKLKGELKKEKENLEPPKPMTIGERLRSRVHSRTEIDVEVRRLKSEADKEFAGNEIERKKRHLEIEAEAREFL